jgi:tripartite-type tricarboxylate transporter receptor subunit TctC
VQQVATGALKAYGVTSREKLPEFPTADCFPITFGPKLDIVYWHAMFAPAGTPNSVLATLNKALQNAVSDPALVKIWAGEDVSVFPPDQRSLVAVKRAVAQRNRALGEGHPRQQHSHSTMK